jgi:LTXXQ motif family protein
MLKRIIVAVAVIAIAGSTFVFAQQRQAGTPPNPERFTAAANARIAALKASLELTPDQAQNWGAYQQALQDWVQMRAQFMQRRQAYLAQVQAGNPPNRGADPFVRLQRRADALTKASAALKKIADAGTPLYNSLTDAQKGRFRMMTRLLMPSLVNGRRGGQQQSQRG